jgi:purine-binding chemotaxis protein CheW
MPQRQFCTFFLDKHYFGIDIKTVQEILREQPITRVPLAPPDICGLIDLRGQIIPVLDLQRRLEVQTNTSSLSMDEGLEYNIVVRISDDMVSLRVDNIGDIIQLADADLEPPIATLQGKIRNFLEGVYKLEENFFLVLDPEKVVSTKTVTK